MKSLLLAAILLIGISSSAQYYYKDIVGTKETSELIKSYMKNKVSRVMLNSYDADDTKSDNLFVQQEFSPQSRVLKTTTATGGDNGNSSILFTYADEKGNIVKTVDSSGIVVSTTSYSYDGAGNLTLVSISSSDTTVSESEQHVWQWENGKPSKMLRGQPWALFRSELYSSQSWQDFSRVGTSFHFGRVSPHTSPLLENR